MSFIWPWLLTSLVLLPVGVALYRWIGRRRLRSAAVFGRVVGTDAASTRAARLRRSVPASLVLVGVAVLLVALARPQSTVSMPRLEGAVILAFDVSGSMAATDFQPTRMEAAKAAARAFVGRQPSTVAIGVVAFSDSGLAVQGPTTEREPVLSAINRLQPERGTSLGQGIEASLTAIAAFEAGSPTNYYSNRSIDPTPQPTPVPPGVHAPAVIVLLSDGENNERPDPVAAAQIARDRGVRIHTVGMGSPGGVTLEVQGFRVHTALNEPLLKQIAQVTDGGYYGAETQQDLEAVYDSIDTRLVVKQEELEITAIFAGIGVAFLFVGGALSLVWLGRLP